MTKHFIFGAIVSALALTAVSANAADWGEKMELCAAAAQDEGLAAVADYDVNFVSASSRRLTIELVPAAGGDTVVAECKLSRGKVKDVQVQA